MNIESLAPLKNIFGMDALLASKLTPEHILKLNEYHHEYAMAKHKEKMSRIDVDKKMPIYVTLCIIIVFLFLGFLICSLKENATLLKELIDKIITLVLGVVGGVGIDRVFTSKQK